MTTPRPRRFFIVDVTVAVDAASERDAQDKVAQWLPRPPRTDATAWLRFPRTVLAVSAASALEIDMEAKRDDEAT